MRRLFVSTGKRRIVLLGATGSIGSSTLKVLRMHADKLSLVGVAANRNAPALAEICQAFQVPHAVLSEGIAEQTAAKDFPSATDLRYGAEALRELALRAQADCVLVATTGTAGLLPALTALEAGIDLALANKELLVLGGAHVVAAAKRGKARLLPTDSEHNALFQCIGAEPRRAIQRLILTASGGAFRDTPLDSLPTVTPGQALQHPTWSMGAKITIDSATMANKGLELIEAHWLFDIPVERLEVVIHPQSIVHSMVEFIDHSTLAQLSPPCMTFAIQNCLLYPQRHPGTTPGMDFSQALALEFRPPDPRRYPCLGLARSALESGGVAPAVFNAANEIAVERFMRREIPFTAIANCIEHALARIPIFPTPTLEELFASDQEARRMARLY
jgi:1-deoxy-D-xylulose-5-phosphate reductoisomerase